MKMLRNFIPFLMAVLIAYGCNKDEQLMNNSGMKSLVASYESSMNSTKVGFEASTGDFYWSAGDAISVIDSETGTFTSMLLDESDAGSSTGTFSGYMVGNPSGYAVYPAHDNHSLSENILTFHFKSEYNYTIEDSEWGDKTGNSFNPAMYSEVIEGSKLSFRHLGGVYCLKVADFPVGNDYKLQFISNNQITGALNVDLSGDEPVLSAVESTENNVVTISFDVSANATTRVFYIPVPVGIHKGSVVVKNANDVTLINSDIPVSKQTIARRYLKTISISKKGIEGGNDNTDVPGYIADGVIYNETAGQYEISNANGLRWLAAQVNMNRPGATAPGPVFSSASQLGF